MNAPCLGVSVAIREILKRTPSIGLLDSGSAAVLRFLKGIRGLNPFGRRVRI